MSYKHNRCMECNLVFDELVDVVPCTICRKDRCCNSCYEKFTLQLEEERRLLRNERRKRLSVYHFEEHHASVDIS